MQKKTFILVVILLITVPLFAQRVADFNVELTNDGNGVIIKGYTGNLSKITIPTVIDGIPVKEIKGNGYEQPVLPQGVTTVVISSGITKIGNFAFDGCYSLVSVTIPEGVVEIGVNAFKGCGFTSINLPKSLKKIAEGAFSRCRKLTSISLPDGISVIESGAFEECSSIERIIIPEGVTKIGDSAFEECTKLSVVSLPSSIQAIEHRAFMSCTALTTISIPDSVQVIYTESWTDSMLEYAFRNCPKLNIATQARIRRLEVEFRP